MLKLDNIWLYTKTFRDEKYRRMNTTAQVKFTILLPIHRSPRFLPYSVQTVLEQQESSFELFIICDGAPSETIACANYFANLDTRVKVFQFEKGQRFGEAHRHEVLKQAKSQFVAHIQDDDLWFPNHLQELECLLKTCDFGNLLHVYLDDNNNIQCVPGDLGNQSTVSRITEASNTRFSICGLSVTGYRLAAYRSLPVGWSPAPDNMWTDLHMWKKFLVRKELTVGSRIAVTSLKFPAPLRQKDAEQEAEMLVRDWYHKIQSHSVRDDITQTVLRKLSDGMLTSNFELIEKSLALIKKSKEIHTLQIAINTSLNSNQLLEAEIKGRHDEIHILKAEIEKNHQIFLSSETEFERHRNETLSLQNVVMNLHHSLSWRITWPLRFIKKLF